MVWVRSESKIGKVSYSMTLRGEGLSVLLDQWSKHDGFTKVLPQAIGDEVRSVLGKLPSVIYVLSSEETSHRHWDWLMLDAWRWGKRWSRYLGSRWLHPPVWVSS